MRDSIRITDMLERMLHQWPLIALLALVGAAVGYAFSNTHPPVYEAVAVLSVGLNPDRSLPGSQYEEDMSLGKAEGVASADSVLGSAVMEVVKARGLPTADKMPADLGLAPRMEPKRSRWEFIVDGTDASLARDFANAWVDVAYRALTEAHSHALNALEDQAELSSLEAQIGSIRIPDTYPDTPETRQWLTALQARAAEVRTEFTNEVQQSHGVAAYLSFDSTNLAPLPASPIVRGRGSLVMAGWAVGLLAGLVLSTVPLGRGSRSEA